MHQPVLYLIAAPIGNLSEISKRALDVIREMDIIAAEDTRNTRSLLQNFGIKKELFSLREHNEVHASMALINFIREGKKVAYMSDAGYPGISDPGSKLVAKAIENNINVSTVSGSSAFLNALVASGLPTDHFYFYGFVSPKEKEAFDQLIELKEMKDTIIFYESPHRLFKTLKIMQSVFGDREVVLARELTKINEEYIRGKFSEILLLESEGLKGELVILVSGNHEPKKIDDNLLIKRVNQLKEKGLSTKNAIEITNEETDVSKNYIYDLVHK